jgi:hypothetical protein
MPPKREYYKKLLASVGVDKEHDQDAKLFEAPRRPKQEGKFMIFKPSVYQADTVYMPEDNGFNYILDVVDLAHKNVDAEPMRGRTSMDVIQAFEAMFRRKYISRETMQYLYTDAGTEFCNEEFDGYMKQNEVIHRVTRVARKNQTGVVEYYNGVITKVLGVKMGTDEIRLEETGRWKDSLPRVIKAINDNKKDPPKIKDFFKDPIVKESDLDLNIGDYVHVKLEQPIDTITGEKYNGNQKFRNGDLRYSREVHKIVNISMLPNQPVRFFLEGINNATFMRWELVKATDTHADEMRAIEERKKAEEEEKQRKKASESKRQIVLRNRTAYV